MSTNFPTNLDTYADKTSSDIITSATQNNIQDAIEALQTKMGINSSAVATSLDYLVKNASSTNPGHGHTLGSGAADCTMPVAQVNLGIIKSMRLKIVATSGTGATITLTSNSSGDAVGATAIVESYSGASWSVAAAASAFALTLADAAITGTLRAVLTVVPVIGLAPYDMTAALSGATMVFSFSALTTNQSTANVLLAWWGGTKTYIYDILYIAY